MYIIFGFLERIDGFSFFLPDVLEKGWREPGCFFELGREVVDTAEAHLIGDFSQRELVVYQELLYFFDPLRDEELLDGFALD